MNSSKKKRHIISIRMTADQYHYLKVLQKRIEAATGLRVTRTSLMMRLMHLGFDQIEREYPPDRSHGHVNTETA